MEIAPEAAEVAPPSERRRLGWTIDNPLVRAVARVPLPLGAKLVAGFALVAALLALVVVLGLIALGQSNTRGTKLLALQHQAGYEKVLVSDTTQLSQLVAQRAIFEYNESVPHSPSLRQQVDESIRRSFDQLTLDVGGGSGAGVPSKFPLQRWNPKLARRLVTELRTLDAVFGNIYGLDSIGRDPHSDQINRAASIVLKAQSALNTELTFTTTAQAQALVADNRRSYRSSRDLLIGIGAGSLGLALALGLLLSWSVVAPLRRTQERLSEIAGGDFGGHIDVPNRDEIGTLAADVNQMNDELQRLYRELEAASRHKSDFLATMSHELRTPLNAIIGFSEVLHEQMFGELNERQLAYVDDVLKAGKHLLSLINDVLDLAKIEAGRMELDLSEVAVPDLLRSAISMHSERADRAGIALALTTEPSEIKIAADERRVRQIVFNLLSNAVKFTPADGRVDVSARLDDARVEIAIADTGPGIPAEDLEMIFEEFEQSADGKQGEGTGLGLPLSRKLVELHGGRLWVDSEVDRGSIFRFTLPVRQDVS
jgi:signal transduction histidine kinase